MTIRRWMKEAPTKKLPATYRSRLSAAIDRLVLDEKLTADSPFAQVSSDQLTTSLSSRLKALGFPADSALNSLSMEESVLTGVQKIGSDPGVIQNVQKGSAAIKKLQKVSRELGDTISTSLKVVRSQKLSTVEKYMAYGALFYLLCPMDLIPDSVPAFGLLDDFSILQLTASYYLKRFENLLV